jgi:hypothetical protein
MFCHHEPEVDVSNTIKNPKKLLDGHLKGFTHWHFAGRELLRVLKEHGLVESPSPISIDQLFSIRR